MLVNTTSENNVRKIISCCAYTVTSVNKFMKWASGIPADFENNFITDARYNYIFKGTKTLCFCAFDV